MPRFAANLSMMFTEVDFLDRFALAARAGFGGVEFLFPYDFEAEDIKARLDANKLEMVLFNLPPGDWGAGERGIACLPDRTAEFRDGVAKGLAYAKMLGVKQLHCMAGKAPAGAADADLRRTFVANLKHAAAECAKAGLGVLVEPINHHDIPGYYLHGSAMAISILDEVGAGNVRLQYDIYHMQRTEGELAATMQRLLPRIGHMQLADNPGRNEPGTGEINYPFLFAHIDKIGYRGWVGCEYKPATTTEAGLSWFARARG
jgi:hydroxypyruvate isomerase